MKISQSDKDRQIYTMNELGLSPEVVAVAFAKTSRSPDSFKDIAKDLTDEKSAQFHEKWVVGYGHASVAEHAVLNIAIENVSILASKVIEDNRLASYTEKSTRYQIFDKGRYYKPGNVLHSEHGKLYVETMDYLFETYEMLIHKLIDFVKRRDPKPADQKERYYDAACMAKACDIARYLLPTATYTNLGMTLNARGLEYAIVKFLSHPLQEIQQIGQEIKAAGLKATPTLIKFANENAYMQHVQNEMQQTSNDLFKTEAPEQSRSAVELVWHDELGVEKYVAALLYKGAQHSYYQIWQKVLAMSLREKEDIIAKSFENRGEFDQAPRECEVVNYVHDILMDYGAFRDVQRHRMATQVNQDVTVVHGFEMPTEIGDANLDAEFVEAMNRCEQAYHVLVKDFPKDAQYVVPLAFRKRTLFSWNLRELHHFVPLRSTPKGHPSYRRIAQHVHNTVNKVHPLLAKYIRVNKSGEYLSTVGTSQQFERNLKD
ncbi:MAG: FAD-dependent thymidylate synthase [Candidatus Jacksonbacteria bacterium]|jgi:thymidylate synthase ThyX|nr:FAD-dependent thymidylate synthase [Candidatus Jacksonbacteria bacterium]MBT6034383.1 FAD-dependent thymidylate synthase [Candidatus Jacksonbacteria bacterium]MBT6301413.1 FAD-dependent thymidylate synthase [Candidatus Jacksonbacteria bacterium]MBT6756802.1 FAD-dependent thymidylate synthase [Candidatus Jacksonbacteria bacterium]MBT6954725.1 FAD-dependent thymidylate synthase [Candidatus Jacksonbacteria bacterium]